MEKPIRTTAREGVFFLFLSLSLSVTARLQHGRLTGFTLYSRYDNARNQNEQNQIHHVTAGRLDARVRFILLHVSHDGGRLSATSSPNAQV